VVLTERQHATAIGLFIGGDDVRLLRNILKQDAIKRLSES
jgi:hypothetical protein